MFLEEYTGDSGKLQLLEEIITEALDGGHRVLLFSQFTTMLAIIRRRLESMQVNAFYLDGNTETLERGRLVKEFNAGQGYVFLISLKAGGTGLNLTGADTVIHYDPWWNPAVEDQASDRAYRIGQKKVVHVMRLIAKGTIEEKIEQLKEKKRNLTDAVIHPGETFLSKMSEQEVRALFDL
jgi:SNF2 family DNA or RNA helicase